MDDSLGKFRKIALAVADGAAIAAVISLPWSTSATSIFVAVWAVTLLPTLKPSEWKAECTTWHGGTPLSLLGIALLSLLWANVDFHHSVDGLRPLLKLLAIPFLIVQFRDSANGRLAIMGYLVSCSVLLATSLVSLAFPSAAWNWGFKYPGVPVKDHIAQSGEFALCGFALLVGAGTAWSRQRYLRCGILGLWSVLFLGAVLSVDPSRTELIALFALMALVFYKWFGWKGIPAGIVLVSMAFGAAWCTSAALRSRVEPVKWEVQQYFQNNRSTGAGVRLEFWDESLKILRTAPLFGHGVGRTRALFAAETTGVDGASAAITDNPHNQILWIAIELGLAGVAVLLAMWFAHARLFWASTGLPWLGSIVVLQNVIGSLFNSHLYDFTEGWTYVFGVGVLGGMALLSERKRPDAKTP